MLDDPDPHLGGWLEAITPAIPTGPDFPLGIAAATASTGAYSPAAIGLVESLATPSGAIAALVMLLALVALSAFFSAAEVAFLSFAMVRRRQLADDNHPGIEAVERLLENPRRFLITILVANNVTNILAAAIATAFAMSFLGSNAYGVAIAAATGFVTLLFLTLGEIAPKAFATRHSEKMSMRLAPVIRGVQIVLSPIIWIFERIAEVIFSAAGTTVEQGFAHFRSEEELKTLITLGTEEGILEEGEEEMIHSVIEFGDIIVKEIMVPRTDMVALPADATLEHVQAYIVDSGFSRFPVYEGDIDNVVGLAYARDVLVKLLREKGDRHVKGLMKEPYFVPETKPVDDLLAEMRDKRVHMAIVVDEFGGTAGLVTMEDVLEEIVGDIFDEYDLRLEAVRLLDPGTAIVDARMHVEDLNETLGLNLPEDAPYDTVAGFVFHTLGRLGKEGEVIHLDHHDIHVDKVLNRRIVRVKVKRRDGGDLPEVKGMAPPVSRA